MESRQPKILIADDEEYTRTFFRNILEDENYSLTFAKDGAEALEAWTRQYFDLVILDIRMPGLDGMEVLRRIRSSDTDTMVIMVSAYGDMDSVIDAMKLGANDFFTKPFGSIDKIRLDIGNALSRTWLIRENYRLQSLVREESGGMNMIYASRVMRDVVELATRASMLDSPVLVEGESGTGKEIIARYIHLNSGRREAPFFAVNCGALSETLLEPTLFGYEKGAFTGADKTTQGYFEAADGGTIFLDEITETTPAFQVKLLRVLQEGEIMRVGSSRPIRVDFRLVSSSNRDVSAQVSTGNFRKDLFYRINVIRVSLPPLRNRREDIPLLLDHFLKETCEKNALSPRVFSPQARSCLSKLPWEGNVREMRNLVERLVVMSRGRIIRAGDIPEEYRRASPAMSGTSDTPLDYQSARNAFEKGYLARLLDHTGCDMKEASVVSRLDLSTLYRKKNKYT
jgi:DNA-binding NtrC family response regulator